MSEPNTVQQLKNLKQKLLKEDVSVLVGAGFSKNVSKSDFLSWEQLLSDIILDLFPDEFRKEDFDGLGEEEAAQAKDKKLRGIISKFGYLKLVSDYLKTKGFAEAIANYIEERTPFMCKEGRKLYLRKQDGLRIKVDYSALNLHYSLLDLPWNNIFTTNYDNLIEVCIDKEFEKTIAQKIREIERDVQSHGHEVSVLKTQLSDDKTERTIRRLEEIIADRMERLNDLTSLKSQLHQIVVHSSDLGLKRTKNIIKLHGSLRTEQNDPFGFDGDSRSHYIISKEDYDNYPIKHEAFTQLMRISLLQQSFCLIGFSGDDPNFMAWVAWVRDIIERRTTSKKEKIDPKVYMISLRTSNLTNAKKLFFHNHRIVQIALPDCTDFLCTETGHLKESLTERDLLKLFFDYLAADAKPSESRIAKQIMQIEDYSKYWNSLPNIDPDLANVDKLLSVKHPTKLLKANRLPSAHAQYVHKKEHIISWAQLVFSKLKGPKLLEFTILFCRCLKEYYIPLSAAIDNPNTVVELSGAQNKVFEEIAIVVLKDLLWRNDYLQFKYTMELLSAKPNTSDEFQNELKYLNALFAAVNLEFELLKNQLTNWIPTPSHSVKWSSLQSFFDKKLAYTQLRRTKLEVIQEQIYSYHLQYLLLRTIDYRSARKASENFQRLKKEGLKGIDDNLEYLLKRANPKEEKIQPIGYGKFSYSMFDFGGPNYDLPSLQYFGVLVESGLQPFLLTNESFSQAELFTLIKRCIERYPFLILFYALQSYDEKFLRRIGQEIALSQHLHEEVNLMYEKLSSAYLHESTPNLIKENSLDVISEFFQVMEPSKWQEFFIKVWRNCSEGQRLFDRRFDREKNFAEKGIQFTSNRTILLEVIGDCLDILLKKHDHETADIAIFYLHAIASNPAKKEIAAINESDSNLYSTILSLIQTLSSSTIQNVFAINNISDLLSPKITGIFRESLAKLDFGRIDNERVWTILLYHLQYNEGVKNALAKAISENNKLWHSNINQKSASSNVNYIKIQKLLKSPNRQNGLTWNASQTKQMYRILITELQKINEFLKARPEIKQYTDLLREMNWFLLGNKDLLQTESDYGMFSTLTQSLYSQQSGFTTVEIGLESEEKSAIFQALEEMSMRLYFKGEIKQHLESIEFILNKILFQSEPGLSSCLNYASYWFFEFSNVNELKKFVPLLIKILNKYEAKKPDTMDEPFAESKLVKIALAMKSWDVRDVVVERFAAKKGNSRYNVVRLSSPSDL